jgi:hypothetical protein
MWQTPRARRHNSAEVCVLMHGSARRQPSPRSAGRSICGCLDASVTAEWTAPRRRRRNSSRHNAARLRRRVGLTEKRRVRPHVTASGRAVASARAVSKPKPRGQIRAPAQTTHGSEGARSHRTAMDSAADGLGRLCILRCDGHTAAEGLRAAHLARRKLRPCQRGAQLPLVQCQQVQCRSDHLDAAKETGRGGFPHPPS